MSKGPKTPIPIARPVKPSGGPTASTTLPLTWMSLEPTTRIPRPRDAGRQVLADAGDRVADDRRRARHLHDRDPERAVRAGHGRRDVEHLVVVDRDPLGAAVRRHLDPGAGVLDDVLLDDPGLHGSAQHDPGAGAVVDAVAGDPHVPGLRREVAGVDDDPVGAERGARGDADVDGRRRAEREGVDGVRVDGRVGADRDPGAARRNLVADHVEARAGRDRAGRDDPARQAGEHLVAADAAGEEVRRAAAEVDPAVEPDDDVVLDPQRRAEDAEPLAAAAGVHPGPADEDVLAHRDVERDAGELDRRAASVAGAVREDREVVEVGEHRALQPDRRRAVPRR